MLKTEIAAATRAPRSPVRSRRGGWATFPRSAGRAVERVGEVVERKPWLAPTLLMVLYVPMVVAGAHAFGLVSDEVYTVQIARASTLRQMLAMARETDLHPPLHYLLERLALRLPGPMWLVARLPSMLAGAVMTLAVYRLTARRLGPLLGVVSVAVVWSGPAMRYCWQSRPYMIWLALLGLLLLVWQRTSVPARRGWWLLGTFLLSGMIVADQLVGIACLLPLAAAEVVRARGRGGRLDGALLVALLAPAALGCAYFYQLQQLAGNVFPSSQVPTVGWALGVYNALATEMFFLVSVSVMLTVFLGADWRAGHGEWDPARESRLSAGEWVLWGGLLGMPALLMAAAMVLRMPYWERYGLFAALGLAGIVPWLLYRFAPQLRLLSTLLVLVFAGRTIAEMAGDAGARHADLVSVAQSPAPRLRLAGLDAGLPIAAANPMTFTEMAQREPATIAARVYYLTDREAARRYSGYTLFENEEKIVGILQLPVHAEPREMFLAEHRRFYLIANFASSAQWLPRWLQDHGAELNHLGRFDSTYEDGDVYLVTMADGH